MTLPKPDKSHDIKIRVERCIDEEPWEFDTPSPYESWVWSLLDEYNSVICDGYSDNENDAIKDAKARRLEELEYLNSDNEGGA